jgi:hypothetical protein
MVWTTQGTTASLTRLVLHRTGRIIFKVTRARAAFTLFFSAFCAVHWVVVHDFLARYRSGRLPRC